MKLEFRSVQVATGEEGPGLLVFASDWLLAVLVRLGEAHGESAGHWFLETGYGRFSGGEHPVFIDQSAAADWFNSSLADRHVGDPWPA